MMLTRRRLFAGAAATAAVASLPPIASAEPAVKGWSMNFPDWAPGVLYSFGDVVRIGDRVHYAMVPHYSEDKPAQACFAGQL